MVGGSWKVWVWTLATLAAQFLTACPQVRFSVLLGPISTTVHGPMRIPGPFILSHRFGRQQTDSGKAKHYTVTKADDPILEVCEVTTQFETYRLRLSGMRHVGLRVQSFASCALKHKSLKISASNPIHTSKASSRQIHCESTLQKSRTSDDTP